MSKQNAVRLKNAIEEGKEHVALFTEALNGKADNSTREKLRLFISRIERMEEEKKAILDDIKQIYSEAKGFGFETEIMKIIIRRRKEDAQRRREKELLIETYEAAIEGRQLELFSTKEKEANDETPHDPETGEVIEDDEIETDESDLEDDDDTDGDFEDIEDDE